MHRFNAYELKAKLTNTGARRKRAVPPLPTTAQAEEALPLAAAKDYAHAPKAAPSSCCTWTSALALEGCAVLVLNLGLRVRPRRLRVRERDRGIEPGIRLR